MYVRYVMREYAMTDVNFEALGRCEYLRECLVKAIKDRNVAIRWFQDNLNCSDEASLRLNHIDLDATRRAFTELERTNNEVLSLVDEYNKYAPLAKKALITINRGIVETGTHLW